ncbi:MAG TPA: GatB/YqeY domain-containing protein [Dehalococcoidia bacterium]|nr:GatB/YqeY domain-containing protein [Dehalococcoidia bacterium]
MSIKETMNRDLREALRARDETRKSTLRMALSAVHNAEIAAGGPLDDAGVMAVLAREVKQRRESIEEFRKGNRQDLVDREQAEIDVLMGYLPQQLSREEIVAEARKIIEQVGASGPRDKGKVMPVLMAQLRGKADGAEVNAVVTELLGGA